MLGIAYSQDSTVTATPIMPLKNKYTKPQTIIVSMVTRDDRTPNLISGNAWSNILFKGHGADLRQQGVGINVAYIAGVNDYVDVLGAAQTTIARLYNPKTGMFEKSDLYNLGYIAGRAKYPSDKSPVSVYVEAGIGLTYSGKLHGFAPIGGGIQFNIMSQTFIYVGTDYHYVFGKNQGTGIQYSLGFGAPVAGVLSCFRKK